MLAHEVTKEEGKMAQVLQETSITLVIYMRPWNITVPGKHKFYQYHT